MRTTQSVADIQELAGDFWSLVVDGQYLILIDQTNQERVAEIHYSNVVLYDGEPNANPR